MDTIGYHVVVDAFECESAKLNDADILKNILIDAVKKLNMEILNIHFYSFSPQGVTGMILLATSHISIHTWPEHHYASLDIYSCGKSNPISQVENLLSAFSAKSAIVYDIKRGSARGLPISIKEIRLKTERDNVHQNYREISSEYKPITGMGDADDRVEMAQMLANPHRTLYKKRSKYQDIVLVEAKDMRLYLDQQLQFSSWDERIYHEALVHPVFNLSPSCDRVLILGGGDGLALREVLKYQSVKHVALVDIDYDMISAARKVPELVALNEKSFFDKRVHIHDEDAKEFLKRKHRPYNIIIVDFPDPADEVLSLLYTREMFTQMYKFLTTDGIIVCQSNSPKQAPVLYWSIAKTLKSVGLHTLSYHVNVPSFGDWGFHIAGFKSLKWKTNKISVTTETLPIDLSLLTNFSPQILSAKHNAIVNSLESLSLHEIWNDYYF